MIIINTVSEKYFSLNGTNFAKIYQPLKQGSSGIGIYNVNDTRQQLVSSTSFQEFEINGVVYSTQEETISSLLEVIFSNDISNLNLQVEGKTDKGGYSGTSQDLKNEIDAKAFEGLVTYQTLAALQAVDPVPSEGTPSKVVNDSNSTNNGYYSVVSGAWVKDADIYESIVEEDNNSKGVNGKAVAPIRDFRNFNFSSRTPFSFVNGVFSNSGSIYVFNNVVSGYIRIDGFSQDLSGLPSTTDGWYVYYIKAANIRNFLRGDSGSWVFANSSIQGKKWSDANIDDLKDNDVLVLFYFNVMQQTIQSPFLNEYSQKLLFGNDTSVNLLQVQNIRRQMQFQLFNQSPSSGNIEVEFDSSGTAIVTVTGDMLIHSAYKEPLTTTAYTRVAISGQTKVFTVPKYKALYVDINAVLSNPSGNSIPDSAYTMTSNVADANMVNTYPVDKVLMFSNWSQDIKGANGLFKDYVIGKGVAVNEVEEKSFPLVNLKPQVYDKLTKFVENYTKPDGTAEDVVNVVMIGDSLFARQTHTSLKDVVPSEAPPSLTTKNIGSYLNQYLQGQKPLYSRYDKASVFTEVGTWSTLTSFSSWDDNGDRPIETRRTTSSGASVQFTTDKPYFNLVDRIDSAGESSVSVSVSGGNGRVQVRLEGSVAWNEANGFVFSQNKTDFGGTGSGFGNTRYQRRVEFRKVGSGVGSDDTILISKGANSSALMYWGIEEIEQNKPYSRIINLARGGHRLDDLESYIEDDIYSRSPSLVVLEIPLLNMIASNNTIEYSVNQLQDFVWGDRAGNLNSNSLKNRSNDWQDFSVLLVVPHHSRAHFNSDSSFLVQSSGNTAEEIYKAVKGLIYSKNDLPFIDLSSAFLNEIDVDANFTSRYLAMGSSGVSGTGYFSDSIHQNDKGTLVYVKHLCPLFQLN